MTNERCEHCGQLPGATFLQAWMRTPNPMLGNIAPLQMLKLGRGKRLAQFIETAHELDHGPSAEPSLIDWLKGG